MGEPRGCPCPAPPCLLTRVSFGRRTGQFSWGLAMEWLWGERRRWGAGSEVSGVSRQALREWPGHSAVYGVTVPPHTARGARAGRRRNAPGHGLAPTWVVASDSRGAAEDLPQQRGVPSAVLGEHVLQGLRPVELVEDDGGCGGRGGLGWEASRLSPAEPRHDDTHTCAPHLDILACSLPIQVSPHSPGLSWGCASSTR